MQRYVVFDEDMREVSRQEVTLNITEPSEKALKKRKVENTIELSLAPGEYMVALRIKDQSRRAVSLQ